LKVGLLVQLVRTRRFQKEVIRNQRDAAGERMKGFEFNR